MGPIEAEADHPGEAPRSAPQQDQERRRAAGTHTRHRGEDVYSGDSVTCKRSEVSTYPRHHLIGLAVLQWRGEPDPLVTGARLRLDRQCLFGAMLSASNCNRRLGDEAGTSEHSLQKPPKLCRRIAAQPDQMTLSYICTPSQ